MLQLRGRSRLLSIAIASLSMVLAGCASTTTDSSKNESEVAKVIVPPKRVVVQEYNGLLHGVEDTIQKYFGYSDVYTDVAIKDRIAVAKITFIGGKYLDNDNTIEENTSDTNTDGTADIQDTSIQDTENNTDNTENTENTDNTEMQAEQPENTPSSEPASLHNTDNSNSENDSTSSEEQPQSYTAGELLNIDDMEGLDNGKVEVTVHICNIDYTEVKKAVDSLYDRLSIANPDITKADMNERLTREIAVRAQNGEFDVHVTVPLIIEYKDGEAELQITEAYKAALTGNWFNPTGMELESGDCPLQKEAEEKAEEARKQIEQEFAQSREEAQVDLQEAPSDNTITD